MGQYCHSVVKSCFKMESNLSFLVIVAYIIFLLGPDNTCKYVVATVKGYLTVGLYSLY